MLKRKNRGRCFCQNILTHLFGRQSNANWVNGRRRRSASRRLQIVPIGGGGGGTPPYRLFDISVLQRWVYTYFSEPEPPSTNIVVYVGSTNVLETQVMLGDGKPVSGKLNWSAQGSVGSVSLGTFIENDVDLVGGKGTTHFVAGSDSGAGKIIATASDLKDQNPKTGEQIDVGFNSTTNILANLSDLVFIRQNNAEIAGDDICLMVSKQVTNVNLPDTATFDGPPGNPADPDTYRVEVRSIPENEAQSTLIKLEVLRGNNPIFNHVFSSVGGTVNGESRYRTSEHFRLVSNAPPVAGIVYDDSFLDHQTILVKLGDTVRATLIYKGKEIGKKELAVALPPNKDGRNAIRTVDVHFVKVDQAGGEADGTVNHLCEDYAQVAVRFALAKAEAVASVQNVLTIKEGKAKKNGIVSVQATPAGGAPVQVSIPVAKDETAGNVAERLAAAFTAQQLPTKSYRHSSPTENEWLVIVKKGSNVNFAKKQDLPGIKLDEPKLDFSDDIDYREGAVLSLNFRDDDAKTIEMFSMRNFTKPKPIVKSGIAAAGGDWNADPMPGWQNTAIFWGPTLDANDKHYPTVAGHEVGHILLNDPGHVNGPSTNLMFPYVGWEQPEQITSPKRLNEDQHNRIRTESGPDLLQAK